MSYIYKAQIYTELNLLRMWSPTQSTKKRSGQKMHTNNPRG